MPESYPFPMFSGLLEPKHYKQIGPAIWLFLWCVSSTTKEVEKDGMTWGVVLGNKPVKRDELSEIFGVDGKTVGRWIKALEDHGYIRITRAPHGMIFTVKNSKKYKGSPDNEENSPPERVDKNVLSVEERTDKNVHSLGSDRTKMSDHSPERVDKNVHSNKDIKDFKRFTATTTDVDDAFRIVLNAFCETHLKIETQVNAIDIRLMQSMISKGIPPALIVDVMSRVFADRSAKGKRISTFSYYKSPIEEAWESAKAITEGVPIPEGVPLPPVALGEDRITDRVPAPAVALASPKLSYQERRNLYAKQKIKEAEERERKRESSQEVVLCHPE